MNWAHTHGFIQIDNLSIDCWLKEIWEDAGLRLEQPNEGKRCHKRAEEQPMMARTEQG